MTLTETAFQIVFFTVVGLFMIAILVGAIKYLYKEFHWLAATIILLLLISVFVFITLLWLNS